MWRTNFNNSHVAIPDNNIDYTTYNTNYTAPSADANSPTRGDRTNQYNHAAQQRSSDRHDHNKADRGDATHTQHYSYEGTYTTGLTHTTVATVALLLTTVSLWNWYLHKTVPVNTITSTLLPMPQETHGRLKQHKRDRQRRTKRNTDSPKY